VGRGGGGPGQRAGLAGSLQLPTELSLRAGIASKANLPNHPASCLPLSPSAPAPSFRRCLPALPSAGDGPLCTVWQLLRAPADAGRPVCPRRRRPLCHAQSHYGHRRWRQRCSRPLCPPQQQRCRPLCTSRSGHPRQPRHGGPLWSGQRHCTCAGPFCQPPGGRACGGGACGPGGVGPGRRLDERHERR